MRSHYIQRLSGSDETASIDRALLLEPIYLETSRYAKQLGRYLDHFPREQLLVLKSEDLLTIAGRRCVRSSSSLESTAPIGTLSHGEGVLPDLGEADPTADGSGHPKSTLGAQIPSSSANVR